MGAVVLIAQDIMVLPGEWLCVIASLGCPTLVIGIWLIFCTWSRRSGRARRRDEER